VPGTADILIIGGGIAGLSAAAALSSDANVTVLEGEAQTGFHASGRSATMLHYALGDRLVRALTLASRSFFDHPPDGFGDVPFGRPMPVLIHARHDERAALESLADELAPFAVLDCLDRAALHELCPLLKDDAEFGIADCKGIRLDAHALLEGNLRKLRSNGGELQVLARAAAISRRGRAWNVRTEQGAEFAAPILINAAGAWADDVARLAGVHPLGLAPKRRTIITFDAPREIGLEGLPFAKTVSDELYFAPESGRLFASPMDEVPSAPCDAQPEEYEVALAAHRMEERTTVKVERIHSRWAGLRTFTPDRRPAIGFAEDAEGFFWLAGQGGFGLQTSPILAAIAAALVTRRAWPMDSVSQAELAPQRFVQVG
jgi:D-arginine dehydrogenase